MVKSESDMFVKGKSKVGIDLAWDKHFFFFFFFFKTTFFLENIYLNNLFTHFLHTHTKGIKMPASKEINL